MNDVENIRIMHIASGDLWAGAEMQLFTLAKAQHNQKNVNVNVVLLNHGMLEQRLRDTGVKVLVLDESILNGIKILLKLIAAIHTENPTIIHTHRLKENILGSLAALTNRNTPSIRTSHGAPEHRFSWYQFPKRIIQLMDLFCGRYLQRKIIAVSADLASILKQSFPARKIQVIENGIDAASITKSLKTSAQNSKHDNNRIRIGIAGRLVPVKRIDLFIETAHRVLNEKPELNLSFHIYGDGPLLDTLTSLSNELGIDNKVYFEGHKDNLVQELSDIDMLLMTSDHEGLPMIMLEAMALKIPVIAHAVGGIPVLLDHGNCGLLVTNQSDTGYAAAIATLIESPDLKARITEKAYRRVIDRYSAENNAAQYESVYRTIAINQGVNP